MRRISRTLTATLTVTTALLVAAGGTAHAAAPGEGTLYWLAAGPKPTTSSSGGRIIRTPTLQQISSWSGGGGTQRLVVGVLTLHAPRAYRLRPSPQPPLALKATRPGKATLVVRCGDKTYASGTIVFRTAATIGFRLFLAKVAQPGNCLLTVSFRANRTARTTTTSRPLTLRRSATAPEPPPPPTPAPPPAPVTPPPTTPAPPSAPVTPPPSLRCTAISVKDAPATDGVGYIYTVSAVLNGPAPSGAQAIAGISYSDGAQDAATGQGTSITFRHGSYQNAAKIILRITAPGVSPLDCGAVYPPPDRPTQPPYCTGVFYTPVHDEHGTITAFSFAAHILPATWDPPGVLITGVLTDDAENVLGTWSNAGRILYTSPWRWSPLLPGPWNFRVTVTGSGEPPVVCDAIFG